MKPVIDLPAAVLCIGFVIGQGLFTITHENTDHIIFIVLTCYTALLAITGNIKWI